MNIKYNGNGNSKENAICFTNAMTFSDYIEMQKEYIKQNNLKINGVKSSGSINDEYIYDIYETEKGSVWFRVPNNIIE